MISPRAAAMPVFRAGLQPDGSWEVIIVDNNSPDETRTVVESEMPRFPVPLRYLFEKKQGR
ncbi:MAG TPA: glycosyltransferase, partial [Vicinamibacterales bacterium]|nr:glycosyltransferase [Vicinamibacterales bacterium]